MQPVRVRVSRCDGGLGDTPSALDLQIATYQREVVSLDQAIALAKAQQPDAVAQLQAQRTQLLATIAQLKGQAFSADSPSAFSLSLANIGGPIAAAIERYALYGAVGLGLYLFLPRIMAGVRARRRRGR